MTISKKLSFVLLSTLIFTFLFYDHLLGLNVLIYEIIILSWLTLTKQLILRNLNHLMVSMCVLISLLMTVLHHSTLSYLINFLSFFILVGLVNASEIRSIINGFAHSVVTFFMAHGRLFGAGDDVENPKMTKGRMRKLGIFIIPAGIVFTFILIYSWSNPKFNAIFEGMTDFILDGIVSFFASISISLVIVLTLGFSLSVFLIYRVRKSSLIEGDLEESDDVKRIRMKNKRFTNNLGLKYELKAGVFLFISLNLLLLLLNILDINHVWFNFEWQGQYLSHYVHQGTYLLVIAIMISIVLVLYFFRKNLHFYSKNSFLKALVYVWLAQNMILSISVGMRNWYYIQYYALAYKRIAIIFFLFLTIYGLFLVYQKVRYGKSGFFLIRKTAMAWLLVLTLSTCFNWDRIIARYNFAHANKSFVHLNFMMNLSDSSLPYLDVPEEELKGMNAQQKIMFSFSRDFRLYATPDDYTYRIAIRKQIFKEKMEKKGWLDWNYADANAYQELFVK